MNTANRWQIDRDTLDRASAVVLEHASPTPLLPVPELGDGVWLKLETLQHTGSFKFRGALSKLALGKLDNPALAEVVTASAGNHGYGLARAGATLGVRVTVCVSRHAPEVKRRGMAKAGAEVEQIDARGYDDVEAAARQLAKERDVPFVSPFDDPAVAAGNGGTIARELLEGCPSLAAVVVPVGGGGLIAGLAAARRLDGARFDLVGVQSEACPAMVTSLREGAPRLRFEGRATLAEGLEGGVSEATFAIVRDEVERMELVSEDAIAEAMRFAGRELGLRLEGSAAVTLAWIRANPDGPRPLEGVITGGNVDPDVLERVMGFE